MQYLAELSVLEISSRSSRLTPKRSLNNTQHVSNSAVISKCESAARERMKAH